jgi:hypothetical protein
MSNYVAAVPQNVKLDPKVAKVFANFYATSDDPSEKKHHDYANAFTSDATLVMGLRKVQGYDAILELRKSLWIGPVKTRLHTLHKIFPFGDDANEVMIFGHVDYQLKNGKDVTVNWAGRAQMVDDGGDLKMSFYQVYSDSAAIANAMKD